jgi:hypothetical protein
VPPGASQCRRGGGIDGGTRRAQTGEPIHLTPSSKARRPCHCQRAAQMAEQRQISRHAHAVDELGTHRSAPAGSASPSPVPCRSSGPQQRGDRASIHAGVAHATAKLEQAP